MKKRKWIFIIAAALMLNFSHAAAVFADAHAAEMEAGAETAVEMETGAEDRILVDVDGDFVQFDYDTGYPFIDDKQRTLVPLRAAMEAMGCAVSWDQEAMKATVVKDGIQVEIPVGENYIKKNEFEVFMDTSTVLSNSRIYLPIRAVAEAFGAEVKWNQGTQTVIVASNPNEDTLLEVHFLDVGHGDSIFINYGEYEVLIDGGVTSEGAIISEYIKPYVEGSLDLIIATHSHMDHVGGLPQIFKDYQVDRVIESGSMLDTPEWWAYEEASRAEPECIITEDEDEIVDIAPGVILKILEIFDGQAIENNNSVTALLSIGNIAVLFTGDSQAEAEAIIAERVGKVDVFKGGHHGSFNANSNALLSVIDPEYIVISAGKGINYTHPHGSALKRMFQTGAIVYGTFLSGTVVMTTNGNSYSLDTRPSEGHLASKPLIPLQLSDAGTYQNNIQ